MKSTENEFLSNKYTTLISDLKQDNSNIKDKYEKDLKYYKKMNEKHIIAIKSLLNFAIEVFELFMSTSNNNISSSKNLLNHSHSLYKSIILLILIWVNYQLICLILIMMMKKEKIY